MTEQLGAAYVSVTIDSAEFEARVDRAKGKLSELGPAAQQAFQQSTTTAKSATLSFQKYVDTIGMGADQKRQFNAAMRAGGNTAALDALGARARAMRKELELATEAARKTAQGDAFVTGLQRQSEAINKTRVDLLELEAARLGRSKQAAPYIAALRAEENALKNGVKAVNAYGLSQKQQVAAMRQVPAQMTDIFTSLQGGQNPLTVLIQQGGQLKDVFGGVVPAAKALGGAVVGLITPWTVLAGVLATALFTWAKADAEMQGYRRTIALLGSSVGTTADAMQAMSIAIASGPGSRSQAAEALNAIARTGGLATLALEDVARTAVVMQQKAGVAISETVALFAEMGKDPVAGLKKLDEQYGVLDLTTLRYVRSLQAQGRQEEAVAAAMEFATRELQARAQDVGEQTNAMGKHWRILKMIVLETWDAMKGAFTVDTEMAKQQLLISSAQSQLRSNANLLREFGSTYSAEQIARYQNDTKRLTAVIASARAAIENDPSVKAAEAKAATQRRARFLAQQDEEVKSMASADERRVADIVKRQGEYAQQIAAAQAAGDKVQLQQLKESQKAYTDAVLAENARRAAKTPKGPSGRGERTADLRADLQDFKDAMAEERAEIANNSRLVQAQFAARTISAADYYNKMREFAARDAQAQSTGLEQQIAVLRGRNASGVEAINIARQISTLESQLGQIRAKLAVDTELLTIAERTASEERADAIAAYAEAVKQATDAVRASYDAQVAKITTSDREYEKDQKLVSIKERLAEALRKLAQEYARSNDKEMWEAKVAAAKAGADAEAEAVEAGERRKMEANANWMNGVNTGLANWMDAARNVAAQTSQMTTRLLDSTVDTLTTYATTGKLAWREMIADMGKQIVAFMMKQAVLKFLEAFGVGNKDGNSGGGGIWQNIGSAIAGIFTKNATGNVYQSPSLSAYSNTVHNTPKTFAFAKGAGVFGEAGWEAIMPLTRGPDGNLGVRTSGGKGGGVNMSMSFVLNSDGTTSRTTGGDAQNEVRALGTEISTIVEARLQRHMQPGGLLWKAGVGVGA